jgi:hypothetical protein
MEMLRIFWDEAVALNPAADARDERHMALSRARDNLTRSGARSGFRMSRKKRSRFRRGSPRSTTTGSRSSKSRVRQAITSRHLRSASASSFDCGCGNGYLAIGRTVQSNCALVPGPCEASCHNGRGSNQTQRPPITILFKVFTEGICGRTRPR